MINTIDAIRGRFRKKNKSWISEFDTTKSIFIHTPKAAGTSIALALYGKDPWHYTIDDYSYLTDNEFNSFFKFSFVRNPFDRIFSSYLYSFKQKAEHPTTSVAFVTEFVSFRDFVMDWVNQENVSNHYFFKPQQEYVFGKNRRAVDFIGRFETISEDFLFVRRRIGVESLLGMSNSTKHTHFSVNYDKEMAKRVVDSYRADFDLFGYSMNFKE